jgi:NAD-dependent SIR2 family protein deacetylase
VNSEARALRAQLERHARWFVLTGAGCSTESGIPAYRDENGIWRHKAPIQFRDFVSSEAVRRRYWARSFAGFARIQQALPNAAHHALAQLEALDRVGLLVTQNVDRLHQKAGSRRVIDLHGQLALVTCLSCRAELDREAWQLELARHNPGLSAGSASAAAPDGDAELGPDAYAGVRVPACSHCGGVLKPAVVFYGETVPAERVSTAYAALVDADAVLVVGSSLSIFSGYRFARRAVDLNKPIIIVNSGATRADRFAELTLPGPCAALLEAATRGLSPRA